MDEDLAAVATEILEKAAAGALPADVILALRTPTSGALRAAGNALIAGGHVALAEVLCRAVRDHPGTAAWASPGMARIASIKGDAPAAMSLWQDCLTRFDAGAEPFWFVELAALRRRDGRYDLAETSLRQCQARFPDFAPAAAALADLLAATGRPEAAEAAWRGVFKNFAGEARPWWYAGFAAVLRSLQRPAEAAAEPDEPARRVPIDPAKPAPGTQRASDIQANPALAGLMRDVSEGLPATMAGEALAGRLAEAATAPTPADIRDAAELLLRVGFTDQAETLFRGLAVQCPERPFGLTGLAHAAMHHEAWALALARWDGVIAAFPDAVNGYWLAARAGVLRELGRHADAEAGLNAVSQDFPTQPFGSLGAVQQAMRSRRWAEALSGWDDLLDRFASHDGTAFWRIGRAEALLGVGRAGEAEAAVRAVLRANPWMPWALATLMQVLIASGRPGQALQELTRSVFADSLAPFAAAPRLQSLIMLRRRDEARDVFKRYLAAPADLTLLNLLLGFVPQLFDGWQRTEVWIDLSRRLDNLPVPPEPETAAAIHRLRARIRLALRDYPGFVAATDRAGEPDGTLVQSLRAVAAMIRGPRFPDFTQPKLFGIGLPRTGTSTLAAALTTLGKRTLHWTNPLTNDLIADADLLLFDAATDGPACASFEKYYHMFPNARFIYTTRPIAGWAESFAGLMRRVHSLADFDELRTVMASGEAFQYGEGFSAIYQSLFLPHATLTEAYEGYDYRVRGFFSGKPNETFLEFNIFAGHGWPELCDFLHLPRPDTPFPHENARADRSQ